MFIYRRRVRYLNEVVVGGVPNVGRWEDGSHYVHNATPPYAPLFVDINQVRTCPIWDFCFLGTYFVFFTLFPVPMEIFSAGQTRWVGIVHYRFNYARF